MGLTTGSRFRADRESMVRDQIAPRGVDAPAVLRALREVPREVFVPEPLRDAAYDDTPLPIGEGQTISQPYVVAWMLAVADLRPDDRLLEIGAGSGYACAVASRIVARVIAVERHASLAAEAAARLRTLCYDNVEVEVGDGSAGWPPAAPYDAILVAAGGPRVPLSLKAQLAEGGRLVMPVGPDRTSQRLLRVTREGPDRWREEDLGEVLFVPLIGREGWPAGGGDASGGG